MKRLLLPLIASLLLAPLTACADARLVEVHVLDADQGQWLPETRHRGHDFIAGEPGHRFSVSLQNLTGQRVLAVLSVDGVNAISGQTAASSQAGYVLEPWQRVEIAGWRKSYSDVAEFYFTDLPDSYAARTGRPENVGVIGVAAFRERVQPPIYYEEPAPYQPGSYEDRIGSSGRSEQSAPLAAQAEKSASADASGMLRDRRADAPSAMPQQLGTGHGQRRYDPVTQTEFERDSSSPNQVVSIFYDSYQALVARGVFPAWRPSGPSRPDPFPAGFTPDPN